MLVERVPVPDSHVLAVVGRVTRSWNRDLRNQMNARLLVGLYVIILLAGFAVASTRAYLTARDLRPPSLDTQIERQCRSVYAGDPEGEAACIRVQKGATE